jgi:hypothetical protein
MSSKKIPPFLDKYLGLTVAGVLILAWVLNAWVYGNKGLYIMAVLTTIIISVLVHFGARFYRTHTESRGSGPNP